MLKQLGLKKIPDAAKVLQPSSGISNVEQQVPQSSESSQLLMPPVTEPVTPIAEPRPIASQVQVSQQLPTSRSSNRFLEQPNSIQQPESSAPDAPVLPSTAEIEPTPFTPPPPLTQPSDQTARGLADFQQAFSVGMPTDALVTPAQPPATPMAQGFAVSPNDSAMLKQFSPEQLQAVKSLLAQQQAAMSKAGLAPLRAGTSQLQFSTKPSPWKPPSDDVGAISGLLSKVEQLTGRHVHHPSLDRSGQPAFMRDLDEDSGSLPAQAAPLPKKTYDWGTILGAARPK
jgi:hypothetical protein